MMQVIRKGSMDRLRLGCILEDEEEEGEQRTSEKGGWERMNNVNKGAEQKAEHALRRYEGVGSG